MYLCELIQGLIAFFFPFNVFFSWIERTRMKIDLFLFQVTNAVFQILLDH